MRVAGRDAMALMAILAIAAPLLSIQLGNHFLWQDEAQTALISRTILDGGIPLGFDGRNHFSQELGIEYGDDYVWRWHTWLPFYLVAGSFGAFGMSAASARMPFALFGLACVALTFITARRLWRDPVVAAAAAGMLALSVPFLILSRQARWYSEAAFFSLLALYAYLGLRPRARGPILGLFAAATLLFHTHYLYSATLFAALWIHAIALERDKIRPLIAATVAVAGFNLPWVIWLSSVPYAENYGDRMFDLGTALGTVWIFALRLFDHVFPLIFCVIPLMLMLWRRREGLSLAAAEREIWSPVALLLLFCGTTLGALSLVAPGPYFRYLTPLFAPLFLIAGLLWSSLLRRSRAVALLVLAAWLATGSLREFAYELSHDFDGPIEGIVGFLLEHADPEDVVAISYGDLPLKFYTDLRVIGGPTGEDLAGVATADWIILRKHTNDSPPYRRVRAALVAALSPDRYDRIRIDFPDTSFENREDPRAHRYRTAQDEDRVQIFRRKP